jgi:hypothetical protein
MQHSRAILSVDPNSSSIDTNTILCKMLDDFGQQFTFQLKNTLLQRLPRIISGDRTTALGDNRAMVELIIDKMNCAAGEFHSIFDRRLMHMLTIETVPTEGRDQ